MYSPPNIFYGTSTVGFTNQPLLLGANSIEGDISTYVLSVDPFPSVPITSWSASFQYSLQYSYSIYQPNTAAAIFTISDSKAILSQTGFPQFVLTVGMLYADGGWNPMVWYGCTNTTDQPTINQRIFSGTGGVPYYQWTTWGIVISFGGARRT